MSKKNISEASYEDKIQALINSVNKLRKYLVHDRGHIDSTLAKNMLQSLRI